MKYPSHSFLGALSDSDRIHLIERGRSHRVRNGTFLGRTDEKLSDIHFIIDGSAKVCRANRGGKEVIIALLGPGAHIGVVSLLTDGYRSTDVVALGRCDLVTYRAEEFSKLIEHSARLSYLLLRSIAERLKQTSQHLAEHSLYSLEQRLVLRLLEFSDVIEFDGIDRCVVRQRPSHQELANMLGVSREAITRALRGLEEGRHIVVNDNQIFLLSTPRRE